MVITDKVIIKLYDPDQKDCGCNCDCDDTDCDCDCKEC